LLACTSADESSDSSGADISTSACSSAQADFINKGTGSFDAVREACRKDVSDYTDAQGQNFDWFKNSPLGLAGPPLGILLAMMDDHDIWPPNSLGLGKNLKVVLNAGLVLREHEGTKFQFRAFQ